MELGIPVAIAINMMDMVNKNGDRINIAELTRELGCRIVEISALKGTGIDIAADAAIRAAKEGKVLPMHTFSGPAEHAIAHIEEAELNGVPPEQQRWYAIKIFERDEKVLSQLNIPKETLDHIELDINAAEKELDDDAESIITNERYIYIATLMKGCYKKKKCRKTFTFRPHRQSCYESLAGSANFRGHNVSGLLYFRNNAGHYCNGLDK